MQAHTHTQTLKAKNILKSGVKEGVIRLSNTHIKIRMHIKIRINTALEKGLYAKLKSVHILKNKNY
jgi:hypothetical protein